MENKYYILESWWPVYIKKIDEYVCLSGEHCAGIRTRVVREVNSRQAIEYLKSDKHAVSSGSRALKMISILLADEKEKFYKEILNGN